MSAVVPGIGDSEGGMSQKQRAVELKRESTRDLGKLVEDYGSDDEVRILAKQSRQIVRMRLIDSPNIDWFTQEALPARNCVPITLLCKCFTGSISCELSKYVCCSL